MYSYEAGSVDITWNGLDLSEGWADDTFLEIEPLNDLIEETFGADGKMTVSKLSGKGATITMTFKQTADVNKKLSKLAGSLAAIGAELPVQPFTVKDKVGKSAQFVALNAVLKARPAHSFGSTSGEKTWMWVCESFIDTDDPSTITSEIDKYIKPTA